MIFDSHAHYDDPQFDNDREIILKSLNENGIGTIVNVSSDLDSSQNTINLTKQYDFIYGAVGVHPSDVDCLNEEKLIWLKNQALDSKIVAIGEIGLDYYWEKDKEAQNKQKEWFINQLNLAKEVGLPVIIHSRDAAEDTLKIMQELRAQEIGGVIHCFSYSQEMADIYLKMGFYIGIGGVVTFKNAKKLKQIVANIPLNRIVLETDCPYLSPEPNRGKRNSSFNLTYVASQIAELRGITKEEVIEVTEQNAFDMYRIKK